MFTKVMILFSIFNHVNYNKSSFWIGKLSHVFELKIVVEQYTRLHPCATIERLLKKAEDPHSEDHKGLFSLMQWTSCKKKKKIENFFILSHRKVSRLFKVFERPLTFREQITNSSIVVEVLISR